MLSPSARHRNYVSDTVVEVVALALLSLDRVPRRARYEGLGSNLRSCHRCTLGGSGGGSSGSVGSDR